MIGIMKKPQVYRGKKCLRISSVSVSSAVVLGTCCFVFVSSLLITSGDVAVLLYSKTSHHSMQPMGPWEADIVLQPMGPWEADIVLWPTGPWEADIVLFLSKRNFSSEQQCNLLPQEQVAGAFCSSMQPPIGNYGLEQKWVSQWEKMSNSSGIRACEACPHPTTWLILSWWWEKRVLGFGSVLCQYGYGWRAPPLRTKWKEWIKFVCFCKAASIHLPSFSLP